MLCGNYILSNRSEWTFYFLSSVQFNFTIGEYLFSIIPLKTNTEIMHTVFNIVILLELANVDILLNISDPKISAHINKV